MPFGNSTRLSITPFFGELQAHSLGTTSVYTDSTPESYFIDSLNRLNSFLQQSVSPRAARVQDRVDVYPGDRGIDESGNGQYRPPVGRPSPRTRGAQTRPGNQQFPYVIGEGGITGSPTPTIGAGQPPAGPRDNVDAYGRRPGQCIGANGEIRADITNDAECIQRGYGWTLREGEVTDTGGSKCAQFDFTCQINEVLNGKAFNDSVSLVGVGLLGLIFVVGGIYAMKG